MPGFDRTGPMGAGSMTGGARGRCNPAAVGTNPAYAGNYGNGRRLALRRGFRGGFGPPGQGRGRGFGRMYGWYPPAEAPVSPLDAANEMDMLKAEADYMKKSLDSINKRFERFYADSRGFAEGQIPSKVQKSGSKDSAGMYMKPGP